MFVVDTHNLEAEMKRRGIKRQDIAEVINMSYRTVHSRFNGKTPWLYTECALIGTEKDPAREVTQYWDLEGNFLAEHDLEHCYPIIEHESRAIKESIKQ